MGSSPQSESDPQPCQQAPLLRSEQRYSAGSLAPRARNNPAALPSFWNLLTSEAQNNVAAVALPGGGGAAVPPRLCVGSLWTHFTHHTRIDHAAKAMKLLLCVILTLSLSPLARTFSTGAGRASCADMKPEHIRAQPQDPRRAYVTLHTDARSYLPGDTVEGRCPVLPRWGRAGTGWSH
ncbi:hypothetical protein GN956_G20638 [Arapaima gigas]